MPPRAQTFEQKYLNQCRNHNIPVNTFTLGENYAVCNYCDPEVVLSCVKSLPRHYHSVSHEVAFDRFQNPDHARQPNLENILDIADQAHFELIENGLNCKLCCTTLVKITRQAIQNHIVTKKHQRAIILDESTPRPSAYATNETSTRINAFWVDLANALISTGISFEALNNTVFKNFLEKWTKKAIPNPVTLRDNYVNILYDQKIEKIREEIGDHPIQLMVDETRDKVGRLITHAVVSPLFSDKPAIPRLLYCSEIPVGNAQTMVQFVHESLLKVWPNGIDHDKFLIYNTDAAPYMKSSGRLLKNDHGFRKLVHVTCIAHGLNRVAEEVREQYDDVNDIILNTKKIFLKAPSRVRHFKEITGNLPLPPEPIVTRWGTWIEAALYFAQYFPQVQNAVTTLEPNTQGVLRAQEVYKQPNLHQRFVDIANNYMCLVESIKRLQTQGLPLSESVEVIAKVFSKIEQNNANVTIRNKFVNVILGNEGYTEMMAVDHFLSTGERREEVLPQNWTDQDFSVVRYASLVTCDVERSFSCFKKLLANDRQSFLVENLAMFIVIKCFNEPL